MILDIGQIDLRTVNIYLIKILINPETAGLDEVFLRLRCFVFFASVDMVSPKLRLYPSQKLRVGERLGQIIVAPAIRPISLSDSWAFAVRKEPGQRMFSDFFTRL